MLAISSPQAESGLGLLGDTGHAEAIFEANRDTLVDPERIEIGMVLKIPIAEMP